MFLSSRVCARSSAISISAIGRYCCKSRKSPGDNFPTKGRRHRRPSISVLSIALRRSPVSLPSGDEVPHIFTWKARLRPREFLISSAKRLLQQYRPGADSCGAANTRAGSRRVPAASPPAPSRLRLRCQSNCHLSAVIQRGRGAGAPQSLAPPLFRAVTA